MSRAGDGISGSRELPGSEWGGAPIWHGGGERGDGGSRSINNTSRWARYSHTRNELWRSFQRRNEPVQKETKGSLLCTTCILEYPTMCVYWHVHMFLSPLESFQWTHGFVLRRYVFLHALPPSVTRIRECFQKLCQILFKFLLSITSGLECMQSSNNCFFMWSFSDHYEKAHWLDPVCVGCLELDSSSVAC